MKDNYETCVIGSKCFLVPYRRLHVERYHGWMQNAALLEATGSEPLSLDEEYEMQESWRTDEKKCTFIVLQRSCLSQPPPVEGANNDKFVSDNVNAMVGDVNLFLSSEEEENEDEDEDAQENEKQKIFNQAELDIMIAEESARGQGIGLEASCLMMLYGARKLGIRRFFCKINEDNHSSLALFQKLGFMECNYAACFKQYEYELKRETPSEVVKVIGAFLPDSELHRFHCTSDVAQGNVSK